VHGCDSIILTTKLLLYPLPFVSLTALNPDTLCNTASTFTLSNGYPLGGVYSGAGINSNSFDPATAGIGNHSIVYTVTDFHGCSNSDTTSVRVENCLGEFDLKPSNDFGISYYPNPINTKLVLEKQVGFSTPVRVKLVDAASRSILEKIIPIEVQKTELDVSALSSGVYYLQFIFDNKTITKVIQKN
jgi:Secretion system C-terminal sorting domain